MDGPLSIAERPFLDHPQRANLCPNEGPVFPAFDSRRSLIQQAKVNRRINYVVPAAAPPESGAQPAAAAHTPEFAEH